MVRITLSVLTGFAIVTIAASAGAKDKDRETPKLFNDAIACRAIEDADQRLVCYDAAVGALATAEEQDDIVVASREEIRETRRGLFGLSLPKIKLFGGGDDDDAEEIRTFESTIQEVRGIDGRYTFVLEDGAVWQKTDDGYLKKPHAGQKIEIRRAAMGSFFAKIEEGVSFRAKRIR